LHRGLTPEAAPGLTASASSGPKASASTAVRICWAGVHFDVIGQQVRDRGQVGLGHRTERQVGRAEAQVEQRPVPVGHP
jgi:hypothetical protein